MKTPAADLVLAPGAAWARVIAAGLIGFEGERARAGLAAAWAFLGGVVRAPPQDLAHAGTWDAALSYAPSWSSRVPRHRRDGRSHQGLGSVPCVTAANAAPQTGSPSYTLFQDCKSQRPFARKHVGSDILTVPVQSHIDARSAKPEIADHDLVQKVRHHRIAEPDLVSLVGELEAEAGR